MKDLPWAELDAELRRHVVYALNMPRPVVIPHDRRVPPGWLIVQPGTLDRMTLHDSPAPENPMDPKEGKAEQTREPYTPHRSDERQEARDRAFSMRDAHVSRQVEGLDFGLALIALRAGDRVARAGWNGKGQYLQLQLPDLRSKMTLPYIFITTIQGDRVPWLASQTDLLARDWCLVREEKVLVFGHGGPTIAAPEPYGRSVMEEAVPAAAARARAAGDCLDARD